MLPTGRVQQPAPARHQQQRTRPVARPHHSRTPASSLSAHAVLIGVFRQQGHAEKQELVSQMKPTPRHGGARVSNVLGLTLDGSLQLGAAFLQDVALTLVMPRAMNQSASPPNSKVVLRRSGASGVGVGGIFRSTRRGGTFQASPQRQKPFRFEQHCPLVSTVRLQDFVLKTRRTFPERAACLRLRPQVKPKRLREHV